MTPTPVKLEDVEALKVPQLRECLKERSLDPKGVKSSLVKRLSDALQEEQKALAAAAVAEVASEAQTATETEAEAAPEPEAEPEVEPEPKADVETKATGATEKPADSATPKAKETKASATPKVNSTTTPTPKFFLWELPATATDAQLKAELSKYGKVKELRVNELKFERKKKTCSGAYEKTEEATAAIAAINGIFKLPGAPEPVKMDYARQRQEQNKRPFSPSGGKGTSTGGRGTSTGGKGFSTGGKGSKFARTDVGSAGQGGRGGYGGKGYHFPAQQQPALLHRAMVAQQQSLQRGAANARVYQGQGVGMSGAPVGYRMHPQSQAMAQAQAKAAQAQARAQAAQAQAAQAQAAFAQAQAQAQAISRGGPMYLQQRGSLQAGGKGFKGGSGKGFAGGRGYTGY